MSAACTLPIARLRLTVRAEGPVQLPPYAGSMLRGAFGHALLALSPLPHTDGQPCALHASCPYCQLFAAPPLPGHSLQKFSAMPQPYVIEPPTGGAQQLQAGQTFDFGLVLIGKALGDLPTVLQAWQRALRTGLGRGHTPCTLIEIFDENGLQRLSDKREQLSNLNVVVPPPPALHTQATLHFHTPLRLQVQGKPVRAGQLTARDLLIALARRTQLLCDVHLGAAAPQQDFAVLSTQAAAITLHSEDLHWFDWGRYSQRQQQEMQLGGLLGSVQLQGDLAPFAALLQLGQWLHIGKNATMGLGGYRLEAVKSSGK
ncbi:MAG TPA: CRISPR system precrRNA processing endoribonuclease RAMP protein Cas6 [Giesbergeria sp.]|nr:CRISPR system precrRNA processing endoribonuclease RAMP protein Cas6 [Giesbergeria sp.]